MGSLPKLPIYRRSGAIKRLKIKHRPGPTK